MADKSFGQFGAYKWNFFRENTRIGNNLTLEKDVENISEGCRKDIKYFLENSRPKAKSALSYTWEKFEEESPSIFRRHAIDDEPENDKYKNTLQLMAPYKGYPHVREQNRWASERCDPPELRPEPQKRRTACLSTMTMFAEEMNLTFPGYTLY
jgi:hypothetical protein